jgi:hypothetical protein
MAAISERLRLELIKRRARGERQYEIARAAHVHPTVLSALLHSIVPIRPGDPRVIRVGAVLGVPPAACFEEVRLDEP